MAIRRSTPRSIASLLWVVFFLASSARISSAETPPASSKTLPPVEIQFGFYPVNLSEIDLRTGSFKADFYAWMIYPKQDPKRHDRCTKWTKKDMPIPENWFDCDLYAHAEHNPDFLRLELLETTNGAELSIDRQPYTMSIPGNKVEVWFHIRGTFYYDFQLQKYPFDRQTLQIQLENPQFPESKLRYVQSTYQSGKSDADSGLRKYAGEWTVGTPTHLVSPHPYHTKWGVNDPQAPDSYSQNVLAIPLERDSWGSYFRLVLPLLAPAVFVLCVFLLQFDRLSSAIQIWSAMFFGVVAEHHAFNTTMPELNYFLRANLFYIVTYFYFAVVLWLTFKYAPISGDDKKAAAVRRATKLAGAWSALGYLSALGVCTFIVRHLNS